MGKFKVLHLGFLKTSLSAQKGNVAQKQSEKDLNVLVGLKFNMTELLQNSAHIQGSKSIIEPKSRVSEYVKRTVIISVKVHLKKALKS